jgi:hypothetical protein
MMPSLPTWPEFWEVGLDEETSHVVGLFQTTGLAEASAVVV